MEPHADSEPVTIADVRLAPPLQEGLFSLKVCIDDRYRGIDNMKSSFESARGKVIILVSVEVSPTT